MKSVTIASLRDVAFTTENCVAFKTARRKHLASLSFTAKIRRVEDLRDRVAVVRKAFDRPSRTRLKPAR